MPPAIAMMMCRIILVVVAEETGGCENLRESGVDSALMTGIVNILVIIVRYRFLEDFTRAPA